MQFTFAIGGIPIRIFRGEPGKPSRGARKVGVLEALAQMEAFELGLITRPSTEWVWRIAVEPDPEGKAFRITLCQVGSGPKPQVRYPFEIQFRETVTPIAPIAPLAPEGVEILPAEVEPLDESASEDPGENTAESSGIKADDHTEKPDSSRDGTDD